ncbi:hypothetical protein K7432_014503 [Basidiobolus ranarum]|uniref:Uncharacterized protein n=1 Tax=Basidiobolus ranarum TaxID=34480 RepID=A0ABR2VPE6_9FUNG
MYNGINALGVGGQMDDSTSKNGNVAIYACFAVFSVFGGAIYNILGARLTVVCGGLTYALYSGSLVYYGSTKNPTFVIIASAILDVGAGIFGTAQGIVMMSYPAEDQKGRAVSAISTATYYVLMVLMIIGALLGFGIVPPEKVVRNDGSRVEVAKFKNVGSEILGILKFFTNKNMLLLLPLFVSSNWFYSYQFGGVNEVLFNVRTCSFNSAFYWVGQVVGAYGMGILLDNTRINRHTRSIYGLAVVAFLNTVAWGSGLVSQLNCTRESHPKDIDFLNGPGYGSLFVLFVCYGLCEAVLQTYAYWLMGALSNDSHVLAHYTGFYNGV